MIEHTKEELTAIRSIVKKAFIDQGRTLIASGTALAAGYVPGTLSNLRNDLDAIDSEIWDLDGLMDDADEEVAA